MAPDSKRSLRATPKRFCLGTLCIFVFRHANVVSTQAPKPSKAGNGALQLHPAMPPAPKLQSEDGHTHLAVTSWSGTLQQHQHPGPKTRTRMSSCTWSKNTKSSRYLGKFTRKQYNMMLRGKIMRTMTRASSTAPRLHKHHPQAFKHSKINAEPDDSKHNTALLWRFPSSQAAFWSHLRFNGNGYNISIIQLKVLLQHTYCPIKTPWCCGYK